MATAASAAPPAGSSSVRLGASGSSKGRTVRTAWSRGPPRSRATPGRPAVGGRRRRAPAAADRAGSAERAGRAGHRGRPGYGRSGPRPRPRPRGRRRPPASGRDRPPAPRGGRRPRRPSGWAAGAEGYPRPALGLRPWLALLRRALVFRLAVFFDMAGEGTGVLGGLR